MPGPHDNLSRPRRELLDQVVRRGERLRVQRRSFLAMAAVSVVLIAIALPLALSAGSGEQVRTVGAPATTTTRPRPHVRVYHQPTTTHPQAQAAKPGERRKAEPKPQVRSNNAARTPPAPAPTAAKSAGGPAPTAPPAAPSPIPPSESDTCTATTPSAPTNRGRIAFVRDGRIFTVAADGTQETSLTPDGEAMDADPSWSPKGNQIVFVRAGAIFVMDAETGAVDRQLTQPGEGYDSEPAWSPDGTKVAFVRGGDIWVVPAEGSSAPRAVTKLAGNEVSPSWSPDSCKIAFVASSKIHRVPASGKGEPTPLIDGNAVSWSLSDTLALGWGGDVLVYDNNPNEPIATGNNPAWNADSTSLVFEKDGAIFTAPNVKNAQPTLVTATGTSPAW